MKNAVRYRFLKTLGKSAMPQALSLEVTHHCIAKCMMCNIWKIPKSVPDLSMEQWLGVMSSGLFTHLVELDVTGGEPFLRDDLVDLFTGIRDLKGTRLTRLRSIAITTNGLLTDRVARDTGEILKTLAGADIGLVIVVAMDAIGGLHDRIRGFPGAWEKANITIGNLKDLQQSYPNLVVGLKTTILPLNVDELPKISSYAEDHRLFTIISPCIITEGRYLNPDKTAQMSFDPGQIRKIVDFYEQETAGWQYHSQSLVNYYKTGRMKKPCSCGFNYLFIRSDGRVFPCPLLEVPLGNVLERPVAEIYNSPEACRFRQRVGKEAQCRACTEPGLERYSLPFEGLSYLLLRLQMGREKFHQMHKHLGMDKYIDLG